MKQTFLNTKEALRAKHEVETDKIINIGNLHAFDKWVNNIVKTYSNKK